MTTKTKFSSKILAWVLAHSFAVHCLTLLLVFASLAVASRLQLRTDFSELLPQKLPSVVSLKEAADRLGGTGLLIVGIESPDFKANKRFVEDFAKRLQTEVGDQLRYFEYKFDEARAYGEKYGLHYLSIDDLKQLKEFLQKKVRERIDDGFASSLGLNDDEDKPKEDEKPITDFLKSGGSGAALTSVLKYRESYLSAENGKVLAVAIRPANSSLSISQSQEFLDKVNKILDSMDLKSYHPKLQTVLAGSVPQTIAEFNTIKADIVDTSVELVILIIAILFVFLWSFSIIFLLVMNLIVALAVTLCLTQLHIGYLNTQTAFLGSLVVGTGINYGVILISRYVELKRKGHPLREALFMAHEATIVPTFIAACTTGVSFITLLLASNQGLAQFGFIGGTGIFLCWIASYLLLPLWIHQFDSSIGKNFRYDNPLAKRLHIHGKHFGDFIVAHAKPIFLGTLLVTLVGLYGVKKLANDPLEYNFDNVRNKLTLNSQTEALRERVYKAFPTSLTPAVAFENDPALAERICPAVRKLQTVLPPEKNIIESCASLYDLYPKPPADTKLQRQLMLDIKGLLSQKALKFIDDYDLILGIKNNMSLEPPTSKDLPEQILRRFREKNGKLGLYAMVNPDSNKPLNNGINLLNFTDSLSPLKLDDEGHELQVSGDSFVLADLLRGIKKEGPTLTGIAFGAVALIGILLPGGLLSGFFMTFLLSAATLWMISIQGAMDLKFNFFNFIVLPLTFGIGIDYPINVFVRWKSHDYKNYGDTFTTSGMAILLCSLTTIIGYYVLLGATSQALSGFGRLAIIGEFTCLFSALIFMPVVIALMNKKP